MGEVKQAISPPDRVETLHKKVEFGKTAFGLLRDVALFALAATLIFYPPLIDHWFSRAKVSSIEGLGMKMTREANKQSLATDTRVDQAKQAADEARQQVIRLYQRNRHMRNELAPLYAAIDRWATSLDTASNQLGTALLRQQAVLQQAPAEGWISIHSNVAQVRGSPRRGAIVLVGARPLRLRSEPGTDASVIGVLPPGTEAEILGPPQGVWARVRPRT